MYCLWYWTAETLNIYFHWASKPKVEKIKQKKNVFTKEFKKYTVGIRGLYVSVF